MQAEKWYYSLNGRRFGPISAADLRLLGQNGTLDSEDLVWKAGLADWVPASRIKGLIAPRAEGTPPPLPVHSNHGADPERRANQLSGKHQLTEFSAGLMVFLSLLTLGIFPYVYFALMHGKLPRNREDDPSGGTVVGFLFIPFYSFYWQFIVFPGLCRRINEQRELRDLPPSAPRGFATAACILMMIPYVDIASIFFVIPVFAGMLQSSVNELVRARHRPID